MEVEKNTFDYGRLYSDVEHLKDAVESVTMEQKDMKKTMDEIKSDNKDMKYDIRDLSRRVDENHEEFRGAINKNVEVMERLEAKFDSHEEKTKFDLLDYVKKNSISIVIGIGVLAYIGSQYIGEFIK